MKFIPDRNVCGMEGAEEDLGPRRSHRNPLRAEAGAVQPSLPSGKTDDVFAGFGYFFHRFILGSTVNC